MRVIKCKNGSMIAGVVDEYINASWILEEAYYKAQGCTIVTIEGSCFDNVCNGCHCEHCKSLEHKFDELLEEAKEE